MRSHSVIAIAAVILVGFGVKLAFFSAPNAAADLGSTESVSVSVPPTKMLPVQKIHDMTFVFSEGD
jgi:nitrate/TMAO reductase-like tetraheme cytochrome c subunit